MNLKVPPPGLLGLAVLLFTLSTAALSQPATPPAIHVEPEPAVDVFSDSVGAIAAQFRVDEAGASAYSIPIYVPPGSAGVAPQVELSYGSRNPTGPMGPGWAISGLSSISRCKATIESGDVGALADVAINFDNDPANDAYCLDGQRLYPVGSGLGSGVLGCPSAGGATGQQFAPELDTATRVCGYFVGANPLGFSMWLVQGRDGSTRRYGGTDNARLAPLDGASAALPQHTLQWAIDRTVDAVGNALVFTYARDNVAGEIHISNIGYTAKFTTANPLSATQTRAPYNRIAFGYGILPDAGKRLDFIAGAKRTLSQQLTLIEVFGAANNGATPNAEVLVRRYTPSYESAALGTRQARLIALRECAPAGTGEVCYPDTQFEWLYPGTSHGEGFSSDTSSSISYDRSLNYLVGSRIADVNGDGRQDLVWIKDRDCPGNGLDETGPNDPARYRVMISFGTSSGLSAPSPSGVFVRPNAGPECSSTSPIPSPGPDVSGLFHLFDFTGDGRDDLLIGDTTSWKIHPAVLQAPPLTFRTTAIDTGIPTNGRQDARLADFNGDGLPDLFHALGLPGFETPALRFLQRVPAGDPGELTFRFSTQNVDVELVLNDPGISFTDQTIRPPSTQGADLNGDGRSDLLVQIKVDSNPPNRNSMQPRFASRGEDVPPSNVALGLPAGITYRWSVLIYEGLNGQGNAVLREDTLIVMPQDGYGSIGSAGVQLADINGDSLADVLYQCSATLPDNSCQSTSNSQPDQAFYFRLNTGNQSPGLRFAAPVFSGLRADHAVARRVQLFDVNGDHRLDLMYQDDLGFGSNRYPLRARLWRPTGVGGGMTQNFSEATAAAFGSALGTIAQQNPAEYLSLFLDWSGDGSPDALRFRVNDSSTNNLYRVKASMSFGGDDIITAITNGLGARTEVGYGSLVYSDLYERAFDGPAQNFGRGSPVFDMFGPLWAVQQVRTSAPTPLDGGNPGSGPDAMSLVVYRYRGARMQSGGRGFLGFAAVTSEDRQTYVRSTTEYRQDYPFLGRPAHTWAETFPPSEVAGDFCQSNPDHITCIVEPPNCGVRPGPGCIPRRFALGANPLLSDATSTYEARPAFNPAVKAPMVVVAAGTAEQKFDLDTPNAFSHSIASTFTYDDFGNLMGSTVTHSQENTPGVLVEVASEVIVNVFGCKPELSPPLRSNCGPEFPLNQDAELRRLGRISMTGVVLIRPNEPFVIRRSSFEYDASTRLLVSEIQGPYDDLKPDEGARSLIEMRTDHQLDANGNRTLTVKCSIAHYPNRAACLNLAGFQQRQWELTPERFQRYVRTEYDALGRFATGTKTPFFSTTGSGVLEAYAGRVGVTSAGALDRNALGDPLSAISAHGVGSLKRYGALGRERFMRGDTGAFSRMTYMWCSDVVNASIPGAAPRANCPVGAVFRAMTDSTATSGAQTGRAIAPRTYAYFDKLGREMLSTTRIYQAASEDPGQVNRWSSVATRFDELGRTKSVTVPYFSLNAEAAQTSNNRAGTPVGATPAASISTFDVLSRTKTQVLPEQSVNGSSSASMDYDKLKSTAISPRNFTAIRQKNAMGEVVAATDSENFEVRYNFEAAGNLKSVSRTPGNGSSAGLTLTTAMTYDRLGRKIGMSDPDKGAWTYKYNALGELIEQVDAKGQVQKLFYDAMGRMWKRTETRLSNGVYLSEFASTFVYDTATLGATSNKAVGLIAEDAHTMGGFIRTHFYDGFGRPTGLTSNLEENLFHQRMTFDAFGRPFQTFDASLDINSNAGTLSEYSADGFPIRAREAANGLVGTIYQEILALDARSQVRRERLGESANLTTLRTYDDNTGRLLSINTGNNANGALQRWDHSFDKHGNLTSRWNRAGVGTSFDLKEDFVYDSLDRLDTVTLTRLNGTTPNAVSLDLGYDQLGNVMSKSGVGFYGYGSSQSGCLAGPHAAASLGNRSYCYDANGNQTVKRVNGSSVRTIKYTGYDMADEIVRTEAGINAFVSFRYGPDRARWKRVDGATDPIGCLTGDGIFCNGLEEGLPLSPSNQTITYYVGNVEHITKNGTTEVKRYIGGYLVISTVGAAPATFKYLLRDVLGSVDVITDANGNALQRMSFDAHGTRRNADPIGAANLWGLLSSVQAAGFNTATTTRGFTGHEQLDQTGLVHMNGRIYDPELGRFIQADPMVEPDATQGLNRYTYVLNNPLSATDPSGYLSSRQILGIVAAVVYAYFTWDLYNAGAYAASFGVAVAGGFTSAYIATGDVGAGLWGAFSAGVFWGIGSAFTTSTGFCDLNGVSRAMHTATGSAVAKVAAHAAAGGVLTELQGGKFGHGFVSAGITVALSPAISKVGGRGMKGIATRAALSATLGGTVSKLTGGKFANGAATSAFQQLFAATIFSASAPREATEHVLQGAEEDATAIEELRAKGIETAAWDQDGDGHGHCPELLRHPDTLGLGATSQWRAGRQLTAESVLDLEVGTAIATFTEGSYLNDGAHHAAIFLGKTEKGIRVMDQWDDANGGRLRVRELAWDYATRVPNANSHERFVNSAMNFSTVLW